MPGPTVSVLMLVYAGTPAQHLDAALGSVVGQPRRADEIVLVVDGPVSSEHEAALAKYGGAIKRVDLPHNVGLGRALDAGMAACSGDWIARADADDVNRADRLEHQLAVLERTGADVCSASMQEVDGLSMQPVGVRRSPSTHDEFARRMRMTNPVNHPAVMFRREAAASAGGYRHLPLLEDYASGLGCCAMERDSSASTNRSSPTGSTECWTAARIPRSLHRSENCARTFVTTN